jgi:hypothetical protein
MEKFFFLFTYFTFIKINKHNYLLIIHNIDILSQLKINKNDLK